MEVDMISESDLLFCAKTVQRMTVIKEIGKAFNSYMKEYGDLGDYGTRARLAVFMFVIRPNRLYRKRYVEEYHDIHKYDYDVPCQREIEQLVNDYGWAQFIKGLEWFAVNRLKMLLESGSLRRGANQQTSLLEKIRALPKWLK